ncbi:MAG: hypothetical protein L6408_03540, partial [Nanoarchaeota archaeon]|nr:hypothetical protein [Nanoarchaeota archaeon]
FYSLVSVMIDDYHKIQKEYDGFIPHEVGTEFNTHLHGGFILQLNQREIKRYCRKRKEYKDAIEIYGKNFIEKLKDCLKSDGARIIKSDKIIMKSGVYGVVEKAEKITKLEMDDILSNYGESGQNFVGERITNALAAAISIKKPVFTLSQTIQPSKKDITVKDSVYSKIGTGKVMEFGPEGVIRKVKLENADGVSKNHYLDGKVYVKQLNYELVDDKRLVRPGYVFIDDIINISS